MATEIIEKQDRQAGSFILFYSSNMHIKITIGLFLLMLVQSVNGQTRMNRDSLMRLLPGAAEDSNKVLLLINIGQQYEDAEPGKAKEYYKLAGDLSGKINYKLGIIKCITNYTYVLNLEGLFDSSLLLNLKSVDLARQLGDPEYIAKSLFNTGTVYMNKEDYENALKYYLAGQPIFKKLGNEQMDGRTNDLLQNLYMALHQYDKGIEAGEKAVAIARKYNDSILIGQSLTNLGLNYTHTTYSARALRCFKEALLIGERIGNDRMVLAEYFNIADQYLQKGDYGTIQDYYNGALVLAKKLGAHYDQAIATKGLSYYYLYLKDYKKSKALADDGLAISLQYDFKKLAAEMYTQLSNIAYSMQDMPLGEMQAKRARQISDSLLNESVMKTTQELQVKYETQNKETQIKELEADRKVQQLSLKQKSLLNYVLMGAGVMIVLLSALGYRTYKQKQRLQQQRISELETEKQLMAAEAVLKGEEQERSRLAKDLHDGLGGMLSGIKYSLNTIKAGLVMDTDHTHAFERSVDMLDSSIREMRRVAHNMMPESLVAWGLDTALKDFCQEINQSGALEISYQSIGLSDAVTEPSVAISLYRIVQELINNILKHSSAKSAIVQITKRETQLSVTVEDDGHGFDTALLKKASGIGWRNIENRVGFLKGTVDVQSALGKGTSVHIEIIM